MKAFIFSARNVSQMAQSNISVNATNFYNANPVCFISTALLYFPITRSLSQEIYSNKFLVWINYKNLRRFM